MGSVPSKNECTLAVFQWCLCCQAVKQSFLMHITCLLDTVEFHSQYSAVLGWESRSTSIVVGTNAFSQK